MSVTSGGTALNPLSSGGRASGSAGSAGISITLRTFHSAFVPSAVPIPKPDRRRKILQRNHNAGKSIGLGWIASRSELEHQLLF